MQDLYHQQYYEAQDLLQKYIHDKLGTWIRKRSYDRLSQAHIDAVLGSPAASPCRKFRE